MNTNNWVWFDYSQLFIINGSKTTKKIELEEAGIGVYPYVTTQAVNNGVDGFFNIKTEGGGILTVDSAVLGFCSYQSKDFSASDHVEKLIPKFDMSPYIAMFLTTIINREQYRYNYGRKCSQTKLKQSKIKLPAKKNTQGEFYPDWQWIENYVKKVLISNLPQKAKSVWNDNFNQKPLSKRKKQLNTENWKLFKIGDIFDMTRGKTLPIDTKNDNIGSIPCVNGSAENNGVLCGLNETVERYGFKQQTVPSLSLCRVGLSGKTFLQNKQYYIADNSYSLRLKTQKQNNYVYMFLSVILDMECYKYSYGRTITDKYKDTQIMLPAIQNANGEYEPDWQFMEDYIKSLPYSACL